VVATINRTRHLDQLKRGDKGLVSHFLNQRIASKLLAMGILPGSIIQMVRKAPFGGGCYIKVDNFFIALRKNEAEAIVLQ
jgi:ferrous iron transport protein A